MNAPRDDLAALLAAHDPIDGLALSADWDAHPASPALLDAILAEPAAELIDVPSRTQPRRWGRPALMAAAAACVALATVVGGLPGSTTRVSAVRQLDDGRIVIDWMNTRLHGRELIEDLRGYGLDVKIAAEDFASPSMVGQVVAHGLNTDESDPKRQPPGLTFGGPDGTPGTFVWIIDPAVFDTTIAVDLYVPTPAGEDYQVSESVFKPGEPLAHARCSLNEPLEPARVADLARAAGMQVTWTVDTPQTADGHGWASSFRPSATMPAGTVVFDQQLNAHAVNFTVRPPGQWPTAVTDDDRQYLSHLKADCG